jgi:hypothetical protein
MQTELKLQYALKWACSVVDGLAPGDVEEARSIIEREYSDCWNLQDSWNLPDMRLYKFSTEHVARKICASLMIPDVTVLCENLPPTCGGKYRNNVIVIHEGGITISSLIHELAHHYQWYLHGPMDHGPQFLRFMTLIHSVWMNWEDNENLISSVL